MLSATKLIRLAQTYSEEQGRDQARINDGFEARLASLEQQVDNVSIAVDDVAAAGRSNSDGVGAGSNNRNPPSPHSPGLCGINTAGLSEWMTGVDKQLEDLRNSLFLRSPIGRREDRDHSAVTEKLLSPPKETDQEATVAAESAVKAAVEATARDECAKMEERVRSLETALKETMKCRREADGSGGGNTEDLSKSATERDRGRRLDRCAELARDGLSRSRSRSRSPPRSPNPSPLPPPLQPAAVAAAAAAATGMATPVDGGVGNDTEVGKDVALDAVEDGTAVAKRASEVAEEALEAGRQAIERSVRAGELTRVPFLCKSWVEYSGAHRGASLWDFMQ